MEVNSSHIIKGVVSIAKVGKYIVGDSPTFRLFSNGELYLIGPKIEF